MSQLRRYASADVTDDVDLLPQLASAGPGYINACRPPLTLLDTDRRRPSTA